jgi:hypothetical protein
MLITNKFGIVDKQAYSFLKNDLQITQEKEYGCDLHANIYFEKNDKLFIPKGYANRLINNGSITKYKILQPKGTAIDIQEFPQGCILTPSQKFYSKKIIESMHSCGNISHNAIIIQETGRGKTFLGIGFIKQLSTKTIIITPFINIADQWIIALKKFFPNLNICRFKTKTKNIENYDIIVLVSKTALLLNSEKIKLFNAGLTIFDEVPLYCADSSKMLFWRYQSYYTIGLTANDQRLDGMNKILEMHFYERININIDRTDAGRVCVVNYFCPPQFKSIYTNNCKRVDMAKIMDEDIIKDEERTNIIAQWAYMLYLEDHETIIMTSRILHMKKIADAICNIFNMYTKNQYNLIDTIFAKHKKCTNIANTIKEYIGDFKYINSYDDKDNIVNDVVSDNKEVMNDDKEDIKEETNNDKEETDDGNESNDHSTKVFTISGGTTMGHLNNLRENADIIITTYKFSGVGFSVDRLSALILASSIKNNMQQISGRIFRYNPNMKKERLIVDIIDRNIYPVARQYNTREEEYNRRKLVIEDYKYKTNHTGNKT